jgi:hypothetical protein
MGLWARVLWMAFRGNRAYFTLALLALMFLSLLSMPFLVGAVALP